MLILEITLKKVLVGKSYSTSMTRSRTLFLWSAVPGLKSLHYKELPSRPVGLSLHGLDALSLFWLKIAGTTACKNWKER